MDGGAWMGEGGCVCDTTYPSQKKLEILFLDFDVRTSNDVSVVFALLHRFLSAYRIALHRGKAQVCVWPFVAAVKPVAWA